jgi:uncharacterized protein
MTERPLRKLAEIWRYPVSTLGGERLDETDLVSTGIAGDRLYGIYDTMTGEASAPHRTKRWRKAPEVLARLNGERLEFSLDRRDWIADAADMLSRHLGFPVSLRPYAGENAKKLYEPSPIHLVTTASLRALARIIPDSILDVRRFRPSLVVDIPGADEFAEQGWLGRQIRVGKTMLRATEPCVRCPFTSLAQGPDVPFDKNVHGAITQKADSHLGIYCDVVTPGSIRVGDPVELDS